ncbi:hypothetical protein A2U01_0077176 [Trifolium medium]|uniref:Uncharacterized protein n=1 Tax=Trifolium medium TaxID=97028 RepID=A0A392T6K6_9FABA|nr:hypothetical protein [Trifolium medium]
MVIIGERVEEGLKNGKIKSASNGQDEAKKFSDNNNKNKEGEANAMVAGSSQMPLTQVPYFQYPFVAAVAQGQYP